MFAPDLPWYAGVGLFLAAVALMEGVAYVSHRWVMHGLLWSLHESHHRARDGMFERNDWFAVMGAVPAIALIAAGVELDVPALWWIGAGITMYGAIYFGFHDVLVHRRMKHGWNPRLPYLKRIVQAHRLHHAVESRLGAVSYGFLIAPPVRDLLAELEARGEGRIRAAAPAEARG